MPAEDAVEVTAHAAHIFEDLGIAYFIVGSLASSAHGIPRSTQDIDVVADLRQCDPVRLAKAFVPLFYLDQDRIADAIAKGGSFNIIHLETMFKVDVFVLRNEQPFLEEMSRRVSIPFRDDPGSTLWVASAEDTVVQKLRWYRLGGGVSDRQWQDAIGVLRVSSRRSPLDRNYLQRQSAALGVGDLLEAALAQAGLGGNESR
jgi:hypothetical protein